MQLGELLSSGCDRLYPQPMTPCQGFSQPFGRFAGGFRRHHWAVEVSTRRTDSMPVRTKVAPFNLTDTQALSLTSATTARFPLPESSKRANRPGEKQPRSKSCYSRVMEVRNSAPLLSQVKSWQLVGLGITGWVTLYSAAIITWGTSSTIVGNTQGGFFAITMCLASLET